MFFYMKRGEYPFKLTFVVSFVRRDLTGQRQCATAEMEMTIVPEPPQTTRHWKTKKASEPEGAEALHLMARRGGFEPPAL